MSKTFIAVDRAGNRRLYLGNRLPSWWIRLSLRLHGWTGEPLIKLSASTPLPSPRSTDDPRHILENDGGKIRDLFDISDPLRVEIDDLLGPEEPTDD